jgi:hypothetical protein
MTQPLDPGERVDIVELGNDAAYFATTTIGGGGPRVRRVPKDYSQVVTVVTGTSEITALAVDDSAVYFCDTKGPTTALLERVNLDGTNSVTLASLAGCIGLAVDSNAVYFAESSPSAGGGRVGMIAKTGGCTRTLATATTPSSLTLYGTNAYFWDSNIPIPNPINPNPPLVTWSIMTTTL